MSGLLAEEISGNVRISGSPVSGASVTLYTAGEGSPQELGKSKSDQNGSFKLSFDQKPNERVLYLISKGGTPTASADQGPNEAIALLALVGTELPKSVTINELTTVASTFTAARFIQGESISGNLLGLRIAAGNVPNFVDLETGGWGKVILDPINSTQTTTLSNLNTLGSLISAFATAANDEWRARFLKASETIGSGTPANTLQAMAGIARTPWAEPKMLYGLFDEAYPQPKDGSRRQAPFVPYLLYTPSRFYPQPLLCWRWNVCKWQVRLRCRRESLERPELDAWFAV